MPRRWGIRDTLWLGAVALLASFHFWFPPLGEGLGHDTYSTALEGKKAFYLFARQSGAVRYAPVRRNTEPLAQLLAGSISPQGTLCFLGPERYPSQSEWSLLLDFVRAGGRVVIAARDDHPEFKIPDTGIELEDDTSGSTVETSLGITPGKEGFFWNSSARVKGAGPTLVTSGSTQAIRHPLGSGTLIVVATDSIFTNEAMAADDHSSAELAWRLVEAAGPINELVIDESLNQTGVPQAVGLLLHPPLRPITVQILIALVLYAWWRNRRFGPLLPDPIVSRQNIVDHTDAVGQLAYRSKDGSIPLRSYLRQLVLELRLKAYRKQEDRVLEPIALRMGQSTRDVKRTLLDAKHGARTPRLDRRDAGELIRRLALIRQAAKRK